MAPHSSGRRQRILLLGAVDSWHTQQLAAAAERLGQPLKVAPLKPLRARLGDAGSRIQIAGVEVDEFDRVFVRHIPPGSLEQIVVRMDVLQAIAASGVPVVNSPKAIEACVDKYLALARLEQAGLTVPRTVVCDDLDSALAAFEELGGDVLVKPIFGSEGRGIVRVEDPSLAYRVFRALLATGSVLYLQERLLHEGHDLRALVINGQIVAAMRRHAAGDFRTNIACGGRSESCTLSAAEAKAALEAASAVGAAIAGVDLMWGRSATGIGAQESDVRLHVLEVNSTPGFQSLQGTTEVDIPAAMIQAVVETER